MPVPSSQWVLQMSTVIQELLQEQRAGCPEVRVKAACVAIFNGMWLDCTVTRPF